MIQEVLFWVLAAASVAASIAVIQLKNIFRAALMLVVTFAALAGLFVLLNAEFLAVAQVLIYVGAISILIIFAVLLTQDVEVGNPNNRLRVPAFLGAGLVLAILVFVAVRTQWSLAEEVVSLDRLTKIEQVFATTPDKLADLLLQEWVLPFHVIAVLLLATILGAIVIIRERQS